MSSITAFTDALRVFLDHLADVRVWPLVIALALHTANLLLRTGAWYSILRAAYPGCATATARVRAPTSRASA